MSKQHEAATRVFNSGMRRITSTSDGDFAKVATAVLTAAETLDRLAPPAEAGATRDELGQRRVERDERVREATAALRAARPQESHSSD